MLLKYQFQLAGLGFGFLPEPCARAAIGAGLLVEKQVEEARAAETFYVAWRSGDDGAALRWWRERMQRAGLFERLCGTPAWRQGLNDKFSTLIRDAHIDMNVGGNQ